MAHTANYDVAYSLRDLAAMLRADVRAYVAVPPRISLTDLIGRYTRALRSVNMLEADTKGAA